MNNNYELISKQKLKDINCEGYYFVHKKTGAKIIKIAGDYPNKTFCISFKTIPYDDSGLPHIMEHSVLNGSKKYPVKSPFDELLRGSLYTFLNAMTAENFTMFPCASMNEKDYFNLMDVYLDAVFNPLIYSDKRILKQEGWRILLKDKNDEPQYTGVVYNEMKGAFSDPQTLLCYNVLENLFPDNCYGCCSGGDPEKIPTLTQENFEKFHKKYYHPENAYIYFFGDADLDKELDLLDKNYLSKYERINANYDIPFQKPFEAQKIIKTFYPASEGLTPETDSYLTYSLVMGKNTDYEEVLAAGILGEVLIGQESGVLRQEYVKAGLGAEIAHWLEPSQQPVFTVISYNSNAQDIENFKDTVERVFKETSEKGVDKQTLEAVLNRMEFHYREFADAQLGMKLLQGAMYYWVAGADPFDSMKICETFEDLRNKITAGFLTEVLKKYFVNNPHSLVMCFSPKEGLEQEAEEKCRKKLNDYVSTLSDEEKDALIEENKALEEFMNTPDDPEKLKCIPHLEKSDLETKEKDYQVKVKDLNGFKTIRYEAFTNEIVYTTFKFSLKVLDFELLPYAALLADVLDYLSSEKYGFEEFDNLQKKYTGNFSTQTATYCKVVDNKRIAVPEFKILSKYLTKNTSEVFDLLEQLVIHPIIDDKPRLKELISRVYCQMKNSLDSDPYSAVRDRVESYFTIDALIDEYLEGIDHYFFVKNLDENFEALSDEIIVKLKEVKDLIFKSSNMTVTVTCGAEDYPEFEKNCIDFAAKLQDEKLQEKTWSIKPEIKNEAFISQSKVQYVFRAGDMLTPDFQYKGQSIVLRKILSSDYLQNNVRVQGGAYGSWFSTSDDGYWCFASYRDPNLERTLDVYSKAADYCENFSADDDAILKYIIGTLSGEDRPLTVKQEGGIAVRRYLTGITFDEVQKERNEILNCTVEDIRGFAKDLRFLIKTGAVCVLGSQDKIQENKHLFKNIIKL